MIDGAAIRRYASVMLIFLLVLFSGEAEPLESPGAEGQLVPVGAIAGKCPENCPQSWEPTADYLGRQIKDFRFQIAPLTRENVISLVQTKDLGSIADLDDKSFQGLDVAVSDGWGTAWVEIKNEGKIKPGLFRVSDAQQQSDVSYYGSVDECLREFRNGIYKDFDKVTTVAVRESSVWQTAAALLAITGLTGLLLLLNFRFNRVNHDLRMSKLALQNQICERKHAEAALNRVSKQNELVLLSAGEGILGIDLEGKVTFVNPAAARMTGWNAAELVGQPHHQLVRHTKPDGSLYKKDECPILNSLTEGKPCGAEDFFWRKDGCAFAVEYLSTPIIEEGKPGGAVITFRDITTRKRAEEALSRSEEQFRTLVESAPDAIFIQFDGRFAYVNDAAIRLYGATSEGELLGREIVERVHPDYRTNILERIQSVNEDGKPAPLMEQKHLKLDGTTIDVEAHSAPIRYLKSGGTLVFVRDITERKQIEESLLLSEDKYRRLFEDAVLGIFRSTSGGKIISVNPAYARMFGFDSPEEAKTQINDEAVDLYVEPLRRNEMASMILDAKGPIRAENLYRRKDGDTFTGNIHAWAVRDRGGRLLYIEGFVEDITERKRAEEEKTMLEAQLRQAQKLEAIGTLAGGIAHDINNILAPIIGYTEIALTDTLHSTRTRYGLERTLNAALRARDLVKQILAFGRSGKEQQRTPIEISSIVREVLKLLRASLPSSIEIRQNIESGVASADTTQIHQVLINLCTNAAHAMGDGGILEVNMARVHLSRSDLTEQSILDLKPGAYLKLSVSDTGSGMDPRIQRRIFDPYFTTKEVGKGSGLGLAVVHGIVRRHNGAITVRSEQGKGTTFNIYLPAVDASAGAVVENRHVLPKGTERILFVDDEQIVVEIGTEILEELGYKVSSETSSPGALEIFRSRPDEFDLVITDYTMPKMTGTDLSRKIRQIRPDIPIILCTGFSEKVIETIAADIGVELVMKPFAMKQIAELVRKVLRVQES
jgi:PAS domain S-box-containing protein